jgi:hypothetical protein
VDPVLVSVLGSVLGSVLESAPQLAFSRAASFRHGEGPSDTGRAIHLPAIRSASEVEHHLMHSNDLGVLDRVAATQLIDRVVEVRRM